MGGSLLWEIEVGLKPELKDAIGLSVKHDIEEDLGIKGIDSLKYVEGYRLNTDFSREEAEKIAAQALSDPIIQDYAVNQELLTDYDWSISVIYNPDVTDNVGSAAKEAVKDLLGREFKDEEEVRSVRKYVIKGNLSKEQVERICSGLLANTLIEKFEFKKGKP
jgi:phosphoribosylformylglycinamidine synthase